MGMQNYYRPTFTTKLTHSILLARAESPSFVFARFERSFVGQQSAQVLRVLSPVTPKRPTDFRPRAADERREDCDWHD